MSGRRRSLSDIFTYIFFCRENGIVVPLMTAVYA